MTVTIAVNGDHKTDDLFFLKFFLFSLRIGHHDFAFLIIDKIIAYVNKIKKRMRYSMEIFMYGETEKNHLRFSDETMNRLIGSLGHVERAVEPDIFKALVSSIISQQISTKAAETVKERLSQKAGGISAESISRLSFEELRSCGLSGRKAEYIMGAARASIEGEVDFNALYSMDDQEVIDTLVSLKGVGVWTAEMMLIFSLQRPNVFSYLDLGIRRGIMRAYGLKELSKTDFELLRAKLSPYCTVASLYFWKLAGMDNWESVLYEEELI